MRKALARTQQLPHVDSVGEQTLADIMDGEVVIALCVDVAFVAAKGIMRSENKLEYMRPIDDLKVALLLATSEGLL